MPHFRIRTPDGGLGVRGWVDRCGGWWQKIKISANNLARLIAIAHASRHRCLMLGKPK